MAFVPACGQNADTFPVAVFSQSPDSHVPEVRRLRVVTHPQRIPISDPKSYGNFPFQVLLSILKFQTEERERDARTVSGTTSSPATKNPRRFTRAATAFSLFQLELRTKLFAAPAGNCIFYLHWGPFADSLGKYVISSSPCLGVLQSFTSLCSFLSLLPALHGQEAGCPSSWAREFNLPEVNDVWAGASLLLPAWMFGKLTNLLSIPSVENNPNCLLLLLEVSPPTWNILLLSRPVAIEEQ